MSNYSDVFLKENQLEKLTICFLNNYSLGHLEIAFAYLHLINNHSPALFFKLLTRIFERRGLEDIILSKSLVSSAHLAYYVGYEIRKLDFEEISANLLKEVEFHWDSIEFDLILTLSLKYQHDLNFFTIFEEHNIEEIRLFYYLFKSFAFQEKNTDKNIQITDKISQFPDEILSQIPYLSFRNYKESSSLPISFIKDFSINPSKFVDSKSLRLSDDTLDKYKYFLRINPKPGVFLNNLLMKHRNRKFVKVLENLQRVFIEILAESLFFCNYRLFSFYLKNLKTIDNSHNSLRVLFDISMEILEEQENTEVFYKGIRFVPNEKILIKLRNLANLQEFRFFKRNSELSEDDEENCLMRGKIVEALIANGDIGLIGLWNEVEEGCVAERNRRQALPVAFQKMKLAGIYLEKNQLLSLDDIVTLTQNLHQLPFPSLLSLVQCQNNFWSEYFKFIYVCHEHCLEYPLQNAYKFLKEKKLDLAIELINPFTNLKPILIVMSLNCFRNDINSLEKLIKNLWLESYNMIKSQEIEKNQRKNVLNSQINPENSNENQINFDKNPQNSPHSYRKIENKCEEIAYNLSLAHYLSLFMHKNLEKTPEQRKNTHFFQLISSSFTPISTYDISNQLYPAANEIFLILETHSLIFTLKNMLKDLNIEELLKELERIKPILSKKLCFYHENNYNILLIYSIIIEVLNIILLKISQKKLNDKIYSDFQAVLTNFIKNITKTDYLLILFELLLKIMRLKIKHLKILSRKASKIIAISLRKSRDNYLINKKFANCIIELIEENLNKMLLNSFDFSPFSHKRMEYLLKKIEEYKIKTRIVYNSMKLITNQWKSIQSFKRVNLKGQEDFSDVLTARFDLIFKNKKLYASYFMNYMEFNEEYLLKLALANQLFQEAELLIKVFKMNRNFEKKKEIVEIFAVIGEKANEIMENETNLNGIRDFIKKKEEFCEGIVENIKEKSLEKTPEEIREISKENSLEKAQFLHKSLTLSEVISQIYCNFSSISSQPSKISNEIFKFLADFAFTSEISLKFVPLLLKETEKFLKNSDYCEIWLFSDYFNRNTLLVEHNLNNDQSLGKYPISSLISDTKNIENLSVEPALLLEHLSQKTSEKQMLINLSEKLRNQNEFSNGLTHENLAKLIQNTIEILSKKTDENSKKTDENSKKTDENSGILLRNSAYSSTNFVKLFLVYLLDLGDIMRKALAKNLEVSLGKAVISQFNYGLLLLIEPKSIISIMIFLLKCENESLLIAQLMRVNILDVILNRENAEMLKKSSILELFNVKKQEDFRIGNRIVEFIFEMERKFDEYKFRSDGKKFVELPIFSVLALLTQDLTPIYNQKEIQRKFEKIRLFLSKCLNLRLLNPLYRNYLKMLLKNVEFLFLCIDNSFTPTPTPPTSQKPHKKTISHTFKEENTIKKTDFSHDSAKEISENIVKKSSFFKEISQKKEKIIEKLFPFNKIENSKPKTLKISIEAFLPKPSPYIHEFLRQKATKKEENAEKPDIISENIANSLQKPEISSSSFIKTPPNISNSLQNPDISHILSPYIAISSQKDDNSSQKGDNSSSFELKMSRILGNEIGNLIGFFNYEEEKKAFEEIIDLLVSKGLYSKAIELFEEKISKSCFLDAIILKFLQTEEYRRKSQEEKFGYLVKLKDLSQAQFFLKEIIETARFDIAEEIINFWSKALIEKKKIIENPQEDKDLLDFLCRKLRKIRTIRSIKLFHHSWSTLCEFDDKICDNSSEILKELLTNHHYSAIKEIVDFSDQFSLKKPLFLKKIHKFQLIYELSHFPNLDNFIEFQKISSFSLSKAIINKIPSLSTKLSLNKLLYSKITEENEKKRLQNQILSLEILIELSAKIPGEIQRKLIQQPKILILYLIRNKKIAVLLRFKQRINGLFPDTEILDYAKSLSLGFFEEIHKANCGNHDKNNKNLDKNWDNCDKNCDNCEICDKNCDIYEKIDDIYEKIHYKTPDFFFFKDLVAICQDQNLVAEACLEIADKYSEFFSSSSLQNYKFLLLEFTKKYILLARKIYKNLDFSIENVSRCSKYLQFLEILELFLKMSLKYRISLKEFFNESEVSKLLSYLLSHDYIQKTINLCDKCSINPSKVLMIWILWLLRYEQYEKAHEILAKNLEFFDSSLSEAEIHQILRVLETSEFENSHDFLEYRKNTCFFRVLLLKQGKSSRNSLIETQIEKKLHNDFIVKIFEECVFFLKNYGTSQQFINFHVQKGLLEEACRYVFLENLPTSVFVTEILENCISKRQVPKLQQIIHKLDHNLQRSWNYLNSCCKFLQEKHLSEELYSFQLFMKDYDKSAVRCLKLFCEAEQIEQKLFFLNKAEGHLIEELRQTRDSIVYTPVQGPVSQKNERISQMNKLISLQRELLLKYPIMKDLQFFVNKGGSQSRIVRELLMIEEEDIGLRLIEIYEMEFNAELGGLLESLARERDLNNLEKIMQNIVFWKKKGVFNRILYKNAGFELDRKFLKIIEILMINNEEEFCRIHVVSRIDDELIRIEGYLLCRDAEKAAITAINMKRFGKAEQILNEFHEVIGKEKSKELKKMLKKP